MMMPRSILLLLLPLLLVAAAADTAAQTIRSPYSFVETGQYGTPYIGWVATGRGALELGPESGLLLGTRYGIRVGGPFTVEGDVSYLASTRMVLDTVPADTTLRRVGEAAMDVLAFQAGLRFNVTGPRTYRRIQPYLVFGGGVAIDIAGDAAVEEDLGADVRFRFGTRFLAGLGGGAEAFLSRNLSVRVDARNVLWKLNTPAPFRLGEAALYRPSSEWAQNFYVSGGIALHF
jgi:hypothetical protein